MRRHLQLAIAIAALSLCAATHAATRVGVPTIRLSHLLHHYAGGGGCVDRFLLERDVDDAGPDLIELHVELLYEARGEAAVEAVIDAPKLGSHSMDNWTDVAVETTRCPAEGARLVVRRAVARMKGTPVDLLAARAIRPAPAATTPIHLPPR